MNETIAQTALADLRGMSTRNVRDLERKR